jgi:hypothetical protein
VKRVKTKQGILSCPTCGSRKIIFEVCALGSDTWNRFRFYCRNKDFYGAWRKTEKNAIIAWDKGLKSRPDSIGEKI